MRSRRQSRSSKHLNLNLPHRKLKLSTSTHNLASPLALRNAYNSATEPQPPSDLAPQEAVIIRIEDEELLQNFRMFPSAITHELYKEGLGVKGQDLIVISKIEQFSRQYNKYAADVEGQARSIRWIIVSNAVNNEKVQQEFNVLYEPIQFVFLRSISAVINYINFFKSEPFSQVSMTFFHSIHNFQSFSNSYACIFEESKQKIPLLKATPRMLWLVSHQDINLLRQTAYSYFFIDEDSVAEGKLNIASSSNNLIYVVTQAWQHILQSAGIDEVEGRVDRAQIRDNLLRGMNPIYCQKVVRKYFADEIVYGLVEFPAALIKQLSKHLNYVVPIGKDGIFTCDNLFWIYYDGQCSDSILAFAYLKEEKVENQVYRIKSYFEAVRKISSSYAAFNKLKRNWQIRTFHLTDTRLVRQLQLFTDSSLSPVNSINELQQLDPTRTLVIGEFADTDKQILPAQLAASLIDIRQCDSNNLVIHNQVLVRLEYLKKSEESLFQLMQSPKVISFNVKLGEFSSQPIYINKQLDEFTSTLEGIEESYHHMIIMRMEEYNQEHQKLILETEMLKNVTIEVYLKYGTEFICRSRGEKYEFLKRDQLVNKITEIARFHRRPQPRHNKQLQDSYLIEYEDYQQKIYSTMHEGHYFEPNFLSTPNLYDTQQEIFILVPKTIPYHSLLNRSAQTYTLLIYGSLQQAHYFSRHLDPHMHATAIVGENERIKRLEGMVQPNFHFSKVKHLGEKEVRDQIDNIVEKFGLQKKLGTINKHKNSTHSIVLFDCSDPKQAKLILTINSLFKSSKVISLSKNQFRQLKNKYSIVDNLTVFELGNPSITNAKKIRNVIDILKVFMSPLNTALEFTPAKLSFSRRQLFVREYLERAKKSRMKGRLRDLSTSRCTSPRSKSFIGKQCVHEPGLAIIQDSSLQNNSRRQKITTKNELIKTIYQYASKGNHVIVLLTDNNQEAYQRMIEKRVAGIIWILVTSDAQKCIVQEPHLIFCTNEQIETVLSSITSRFRLLKQLDFKMNDKEVDLMTQQDVFLINAYKDWEEYLLCLLPTDEPISLVQGISKKKHLELEQLNGALIFGKGSKYQSVVALFQDEKRKNSTQTQSDQANENIIILVHSNNRQFIQRCLIILAESNCLIVTYKCLEDLICYVQLSKTLLILQERDNIAIGTSLRLHPADTPASFSAKLGGFMDSLRRGL